MGEVQGFGRIRRRSTPLRSQTVCKGFATRCRARRQGLDQYSGHCRRPRARRHSASPQRIGGARLEALIAPKLHSGRPLLELTLRDCSFGGVSRRHDGRVRWWLAVGAVVALLAGCGGQRSNNTAGSAAEPTSCTVTADARLSIATGNTTGVYYTLGGAYAEAISAATGGKLKATAAETSASLQNIQQLVAGTYQIAFSLADTAVDAVNGTASFKQKQPVAALSRLYPN